MRCIWRCALPSCKSTMQGTSRFRSLPTISCSTWTTAARRRRCGPSPNWRSRVRCCCSPTTPTWWTWPGAPFLPASWSSTASRHPSAQTSVAAPPAAAERGAADAAAARVEGKRKLPVLLNQELDDAMLLGRHAVAGPLRSPSICRSLLQIPQLGLTQTNRYGLADTPTKVLRYDWNPLWRPLYGAAVHLTFLVPARRELVRRLVR